jgi:hypothetical protein
MYRTKALYVFFISLNVLLASHSIQLKCLIQSLTTYLNLHFKVLPASMSMCPGFHLHSGFLENVFCSLITPICTTCPAHRILLDLIKSLMHFEDKLRNSSSWNFVLPPITSLFLVVRFNRPYTPTRLGNKGKVVSAVN